MDNTGQGDRYYMTVFACESAMNLPQYAHTFATFVRASSDSPSHLDCVTISWLPETAHVVLLWGTAERGKNFSLEETLAWAGRNGVRISAWGAYEIRRELFERAVAQAERLSRGELRYRALDGGDRGEGVTNCIHALTDLDTDKGLLNTGLAYGCAASALVVKHLQRWIIDPAKLHPQIATLGGLNEYDIHFESPQSYLNA